MNPVRLNWAICLGIFCPFSVSPCALHSHAGVCRDSCMHTEVSHTFDPCLAWHSAHTMLRLIWWRICLFESHIRSGLQPGVCPRQGIPAADALSSGHCDPLPCAQRPWPGWHLHPMISSSPPDWQARLGVAPRQRNAIVMGSAVQMLRVCWLAQSAA